MKKMASLDNNNNCGQNKLPEIYPMEECHHHRRLRLFRYHHQSNIRANTLLRVRFLSRYINCNDGLWIGQFYSRTWGWFSAIIHSLTREISVHGNAIGTIFMETDMDDEHPQDLPTNAFHPNTVSTTEQRMCEPLIHRQGHWVQNPWLRYRCRENTIMTPVTNQHFGGLQGGWVKFLHFGTSKPMRRLSREGEGSTSIYESVNMLQLQYPPNLGHGIIGIVTSEDLRTPWICPRKLNAPLKDAYISQFKINIMFIHTCKDTSHPLTIQGRWTLPFGMRTKTTPPRHSTPHHLTHFLNNPLILTNWTFFMCYRKRGVSTTTTSTPSMLSATETSSLTSKTTTKSSWRLQPQFKAPLHLRIRGHSNAIIVRDTWFETKMENPSDINTPNTSDMLGMASRRTHLEGTEMRTTACRILRNYSPINVLACIPERGE